MPKLFKGLPPPNPEPDRQLRRWEKIMERRRAKVPNMRSVTINDCCMMCRSYWGGDDDNEPSCSKYQIDTKPDNLCDSFVADR